MEEACTSDDEKAKILSQFFIDEDFMRQEESEEDTFVDFEKRKLEAQELKSKANDLFVRSKNFPEASKLYTHALHICPVTRFNDLRAVLYSNRAAALAKMDLIDEAIQDCTKALEFDPDFLKAYFRRAQLYEQKDDLEKSLQDYQTILSKKSDDQVARNQVLRLNPLVEEKREKLKNEMIDKLKDLGNVFLRPFGLSTDNFVLEQNQQGGYSINMKK